MKLKTLLKETKVWERKFGDPLPTLNSVMEKHQQKEGGKGSGRKAKPGSAKDVDNKAMKAATDANAKMDRDEKEMERKAKEQAFKDMANEEVNEQGRLSRQAGINVFGDKKLELIAKSLINTAKDLHHTARKKDERNFDGVLDRITITLGVIRSYLNKPKRSM